MSETQFTVAYISSFFAEDFNSKPGTSSKKNKFCYNFYYSSSIKMSPSNERDDQLFVGAKRFCYFKENLTKKQWEHDTLIKPMLPTE